MNWLRRRRAARQVPYLTAGNTLPASTPVSVSQAGSALQAGSASQVGSASQADPPLAAAHDPLAALRFPAFRLLVGGKFVASLGDQMSGVAVGWELYGRTHSALALGYVGLVRVAPLILLSLYAGHIADRVSRKRVAIASQVALALGAAGLTALSVAQGPIPLYYACLLLIGIANAFNNPAAAALLPRTVPAGVFPNAATWSSSAWQFAAVLGPALGGAGIALGHGAAPVYGAEVVAVALAVALVAGLPPVPPPVQARAAPTLASLAEGVTFVWRTRVILATITLDLFAVLLGGATTLMPIFARDILRVGPTGLGWLQAAPSLGALGMSALLALAPPLRRAGPTLLLAVAGFGAATVVFGLSRDFLLSLGALAVLGALDMISVVVRSTLVLTRTPDAMRGRVSAVNSVFVGTSNQLGGFESGVTAALFGPVASVVGGGIGTVAVVLLVAWLLPEVRRLRDLAGMPGGSPGG